MTVWKGRFPISYAAHFTQAKSNGKKQTHTVVSTIFFIMGMIMMFMIIMSMIRRTFLVTSYKQKQIQKKDKQRELHISSVTPKNIEGKNDKQ